MWIKLVLWKCACNLSDLVRTCGEDSECPPVGILPSLCSHRNPNSQARHVAAQNNPSLLQSPLQLGVARGYVLTNGILTETNCKSFLFPFLCLVGENLDVFGTVRGVLLDMRWRLLFAEEGRGPGRKSLSSPYWPWPPTFYLPEK